ncbi:unnamed protein product, partial [Ectocarpus sp. 6 AP-2014]
GVRPPGERERAGPQLARGEGGRVRGAVPARDARPPADGEVRGPGGRRGRPRAAHGEGVPVLHALEGPGLRPGQGRPRLHPPFVDKLQDERLVVPVAGVPRAGAHEQGLRARLHGGVAVRAAAVRRPGGRAGRAGEDRGGRVGPVRGGRAHRRPGEPAQAAAGRHAVGEDPGPEAGRGRVEALGGARGAPSDRRHGLEARLG